MFSFLLMACGSFRSNLSGYQSKARGFKGNGTAWSTKNMSMEGRPKLLWPVEEPTITRGFKPLRRGQKHYGLDIAGPLNKKIIAAHPGLVIYAGSGYTGYGKVVIIEYSEKWATLYAHLNKFYVKEGQYVNAGDAIGGMGRTGRSTGVHLHFELIKNKLPVNPLNYLKKQ